MASESTIYNLDNPFHQQQKDDSPPVMLSSFYPVPLPPPENWIAGRQLFPGQVIAGYNAIYDDYNADTWAKLILEKARGFEAATSCSSFSGERFFYRAWLGSTCRTDLMVIQAINSGTPKDRYWFGYIFRGGPITAHDFQRKDGVEGSRVFR